jgi:hypothetical protein
MIYNPLIATKCEFLLLPILLCQFSQSVTHKYSMLSAHASYVNYEIAMNQRESLFRVRYAWSDGEI